jgi:hypothetical protein
MPDENKKVGDIYKTLPGYDNTNELKLEPESPDDFKAAEEKPPSTMYGYPAQMQTKITPLHKKGKLAPSYKEDPKFFEFRKKRKAKKDAKKADEQRRLIQEISRNEAIEKGDYEMTTTPLAPKTTNKKKIKTRHIPIKF